MMRLLTMKTSVGLAAASHRMMSTQPNLDMYVEPCGIELPADFHYFPKFLNGDEQRVLLLSALRKLDDSDSRGSRRRRKRKHSDSAEPQNLSHLFLPDNYYDFEEGHYDGVITQYRETLVTTWPEHPSLEPILLRLQGLLPAALKTGIQTHILHLASNGHILPHVDNTEASGSWIAAVSLGGERILRMESELDGNKSYELLLPSGSAYVQSGAVRYSYKHSILAGGSYFKGRCVPESQRISVMLRDRLQPNHTE